jgi:magnesium transporter
LLFLTEILGAEVIDVHQRRAGTVRDLTAQIREPYPVVTGLVVSRRRQQVIPWAAVRTFAAVSREVVLRGSRDEVQPQPADQRDIWLGRDVLDKQVVDIDGRRVVRVNDLQLVASGGDLLLVGADIGVRGLLRRLGLEGAAKWVAHLFQRDLPMALVSWETVGPLVPSGEAQGGPGDDAVRLRVSARRIARLHPADIADIVENLGARERQTIFAALSGELAADTLEEMELADQVSVIEHMDPRRASQILDQMSPDGVADILSELPQERADRLLGLMQKDEAAEVKELLGYRENTAGGLMTTQFVTVSEQLTAQQCIDELRRMEPEAESVYSIFVTDPQDHLKGVLSLRDLIMAQPDRPIKELMVRDVIAVSAEDSAQEVAAVLSKYNLLAVPVVDDEFRIQGLVTVDDVLEAVLPSSVKRRLPRTV